jgi:hypothetical protein
MPCKPTTYSVRFPSIAQNRTVVDRDSAPRSWLCRYHDPLSPGPAYCGGGRRSNTREMAQSGCQAVAVALSSWQIIQKALASLGAFRLSASFNRICKRCHMVHAQQPQRHRCVCGHLAASHLSIANISLLMSSHVLSCPLMWTSSVCRSTFLDRGQRSLGCFCWTMDLLTDAGLIAENNARRLFPAVGERELDDRR